jgi:predicted transposase YbfD/YdcC
MEGEERSPEQWLQLIRNHWGGIENRNHWRRDACWGEDRTRSRNRNIVGALALLRNALLAIAADHMDTYGSLPAFSEACEHDTSFALRLIRRHL